MAAVASPPLRRMRQVDEQAGRLSAAPQLTATTAFSPVSSSTATDESEHEQIIRKTCSLPCAAVRQSWTIYLLIRRAPFRPISRYTLLVFADISEAPTQLSRSQSSQTASNDSWVEIHSQQSAASSSPCRRIVYASDHLSLSLAIDLPDLETSA